MSATPRTELEALRRRVQELEAQVSAADAPPAAPTVELEVRPPPSPSVAGAGAREEPAEEEPEQEADAPAAVEVPEAAADLPALQLPAEELPPVVRKVVAQLRAALEAGASLSRTRFVVLVLSGGFNPLHGMHTRRLYLVRRFLQAHVGATVLGGLLSPAHDTFVRQKMRTRPKQMMPSRLRLGACRRFASSSSWIGVDDWEVSRRRLMDYLSVLGHVDEALRAWLPGVDARVCYVCSASQLIQLSPAALREAGYSCATVCRPGETERLVRELDGRWTGVAHIVEDGAVLPVELARSSPASVRRELMAGADPLDLAPVLGEPVARYLKRHKVPDKWAGRAPWTAEDKREVPDEERRRSGQSSAPSSVSVSVAGSAAGSVAGSVAGSRSVSRASR